MDDYIMLGAAVFVGLLVGYLIGKPKSSDVVADKVTYAQPEWWELRKTLTGTQLQILQYLESKKEITIEKLQEKFSFIPDRELYYRLEQIVLMNFVIRGRKGNDVIYTLNSDYSGTVEDDKTVMLGAGDDIGDGGGNEGS